MEPNTLVAWSIPPQRPTYYLIMLHILTLVRSAEERV